MARRHSKPPVQMPEMTESPQPDETHLNELLDEALEETFPASDPPAMLEPKCRGDR